MFRNAIFYRIGDVPRDVAFQLGQHPLQPCGDLERVSHGWLWAGPYGSSCVMKVGHQLLLWFGSYQRLLPNSVVNQELAQRAVKIALDQGFAVGRKQRSELKRQVIDELLPKAFSTRSVTQALIDPEAGFIAIDTASQARAELLLDYLARATGIEASYVAPEYPTAGVLTEWLNDAPADGFTIDDTLELHAGKEVIRYSASPLNELPAENKVVAKLGLTWRDQLSFVLTDKMALRRVRLVNPSEHGADSAEEQFLGDIIVFGASLRGLYEDLVRVHS